MPRIARRITLWSRNEIIALLHSAKRVCRHAGLDIAVAPVDGLGRILIIIPSRVGTAPQRNRIRRRIKAIFYENKLYEKGFNWVFFVKPAASCLSFQELHALIISTCLPSVKKS